MCHVRSGESSATLSMNTGEIFYLSPSKDFFILLDGAKYKFNVMKRSWKSLLKLCYFSTSQDS